LAQKLPAIINVDFLIGWTFACYRFDYKEAVFIHSGWYDRVLPYWFNVKQKKGTIFSCDTQHPQLAINLSNFSTRQLRLPAVYICKVNI